MVHSCFDLFPTLAEEGFILEELAQMLRKESSTLKTEGSLGLKRVVDLLTKDSKFEVPYRYVFDIFRLFSLLFDILPFLKLLSYCLQSREKKHYPHPNSSICKFLPCFAYSLLYIESVEISFQGHQIFQNGIFFL